MSTAVIRSWGEKAQKHKYKLLGAILTGGLIYAIRMYIVNRRRQQTLGPQFQVPLPLQMPRKIMKAQKKFEVKEFNEHESVFIRDPDELKSKIRKFKEDGLSELQIVSDFDQTITPKKLNGENCASTFGIFRHTDVTSTNYKQNAHANFAKYHPIETDPLIPHEDKRAYMREWLEKHEVLLQEEGINFQRASQALELVNIGVRNGFQEFLMKCNRLKIPFFIISGGIKNFISEIIYQFIDQENGYPELEIHSNEMLFDINDNFVAFDRPIIHSFDKQYVLDSQQRKFRKNVFLMGDLQSDFLMAKNMDYEQIISVIFYNDKEICEKTKVYLFELYDVIIINDGNYKPIIQILDEIAAKE